MVASAYLDELTPIIKDVVDQAAIASRMSVGPQASMTAVAA